MPVVTRIANPFAISHHKRFTVLNPIPAPSACYETALYLLCRPYGTRFHFSTHPALTRLLRTSVVPTGTRIYFPLYPALRLRPRAGLNYFAPAGLALAYNPETRSHLINPGRGQSPVCKRPSTARLKPCPFKTGFMRCLLVLPHPVAVTAKTNFSTNSLPMSGLLAFRLLPLHAGSLRRERSHLDV